MPYLDDVIVCWANAKSLSDDLIDRPKQAEDLFQDYRDAIHPNRAIDNFDILALTDSLRTASKLSAVFKEYAENLLKETLNNDLVSGKISKLFAYKGKYIETDIDIIVKKLNERFMWIYVEPSKVIDNFYVELTAILDKLYP